MPSKFFHRLTYCLRWFCSWFQTKLLLIPLLPGSAPVFLFITIPSSHTHETNVASFGSKFLAVKLVLSTELMQLDLSGFKQLLGSLKRFPTWAISWILFWLVNVFSFSCWPFFPVGSWGSSYQIQAPFVGDITTRPSFWGGSYVYFMKDSYRYNSISGLIFPRTLWVEIVSSFWPPRVSPTVCYFDSPAGCPAISHFSGQYK